MTATIERRTVLKLLGGVTAGTVATTGVRAQSTTQWPQYQFDSANTGSSSSVSGPATGVSLRWKATPASDGITTHPTLVDGTLFVGSWDNHLYALNAETGKTIWKQNLESSIHYPAPAVGSEHIVIGTEDGTIHALTKEDGQIDWTVNTQSAIVGSATIADGMVYIPNMAGTLVALSEKDGTERWRFERSGIEPIMATPAVKDGTVYVGSMVFNEVPENQSNLNPRRQEGKEKLQGMDAEGRLYAINTEEGSLRWQKKTGHIVVAAPVIGQDTLFMGSWDRFCYALSLEDGTERWRVSLPDVITAPPVLVDNTLYVGAWNGEILALQIGNGTTKWQSSVEGRIISPSTSDGTNLYVTDNRRIIALRLEDGVKQWTFNTQAWEVEAPAIGNGMVFGTDGHGRVFGIEEGSSFELKAPASGGNNRAFSGERGFFTNSGDPPVEPLNNPLVLTVGGFILSAIGLVHQLISGR